MIRSYKVTIRGAPAGRVTVGANGTVTADPPALLEKLAGYIHSFRGAVGDGHHLYSQPLLAAAFADPPAHAGKYGFEPA